VDQVLTRLRNTEFESSSITGDRRIGKTSLLNYLASSESRQARGLDPVLYTFVYVDLQMVDSATTPSRLWRRLLEQLAHESSHIAIRERLTDPSVLTALDTFALDQVFEHVDRCGQYVVFLLDEFEHVTKNPNFGPDFFYGLRSLATRHRLALVTASRWQLNELCHSEEIRSSPFFNIFANIDLSLLSEADAKELLSDPCRGLGSSLATRSNA
jgi:Cdc6-like AAA superfamily ATPase